jgi:hypothetical protein
MARVSDRLVTVYRASTLEAADLARMDLAAAGIEAFIEGEHAASTLGYMGLGLNPGGIKVMVPAIDAEHAEWLLTGRATEEAVAAEPFWAAGAKTPMDTPETAIALQRPPLMLEYAGRRHSADDYARRSARALVLVLFCPPLVLLSLYYAIQALREARRTGVADRGRFGRRLALVVLILAAMLVAGAAMCWEFFAGGAAWVWPLVRKVLT